MDNQNFKIFWDEALNQLKEDYKNQGKDEIFTLWFNMTFVESTLSNITVSVPSTFMWSKQVEMGIVNEIERKIEELSGHQISLNYIVKKNTPAPEPVQPKEESKPVVEEIKTTSSAIEAEKTEKDNSYITGIKKHPLLNENYIFENFVKGENSEFAYSASLAAAKEPGRKYSPLLIYGGVGLGKTHLMQAVGNYIYNHVTSPKICYISAEEFANEFTKSLRDGTSEKFKLKYRCLDVLLLDDIHFLIGKKGIQEELFYTFEALNQKHAQMIFTCDRPLSELKGIEERLMSRFGLGTPIDLAPPSYEIRRAILQKKLSLYNKEISEEIIDYIAKTVQSNVRDLESSLKIIVNYSDLITEELTIDIVKKLLKDTFTPTSNDSISIDTIQKVVADRYNISISDIKGKKRVKKFVIPRNIAIYIGRELCDYSFPSLGEEFGGRDHTTIMHSYNAVCDQLKIDSSLNSQIQLLIREIREYKKY